MTDVSSCGIVCAGASACPVYPLLHALLKCLHTWCRAAYKGLSFPVCFCQLGYGCIGTCLSPCCDLP